MNKLKLTTGREIELKELSLDEEAEIMDTTRRKIDADGNIISEMEYTAMIKFLRMSLNGKADDKFIKSLSYQEKSEIYTHFQKSVITGEGTASSSK